MDSLAHAVGVERVVEPLGQRLARQADSHRDSLRALEEPVEMAVEKLDFALVDAKPLPDSVAEHEAAVENRNRRLLARLQFAVEVDEDRRVARVRNVVK